MNTLIYIYTENIHIYIIHVPDLHSQRDTVILSTHCPKQATPTPLPLFCKKWELFDTKIYVKESRTLIRRK